MDKAPSWFVVGGGQDGTEFKVLFVFVLLTLLYLNGLYYLKKS
jgi:hypothetical protein